MARGEVFIVLPTGESFPARTDLAGHGAVGDGEEFLARETWANGQGLKRGGRRLRVRVARVEKVHNSYHRLHVEVLQDLTPPPQRQGDLFD